jgi:DNA-binding NtrC family response regulator
MNNVSPIENSDDGTQNPKDDIVSIVCVDDDADSIRTLGRYLDTPEFLVRTYTDPDKCLDAFIKYPADIVISDLRMPRTDGLALLDKVKSISASTDVIIITGNADKEAAIRALKLGAFSLLEKPVNRDELLETVRRTVRYRTALQQRDRLAEQLAFVSSQEAKRSGVDAFVGESGAMRKLLADIRALQKTAKTTVLITGESGTGKELVARAIHSDGSRSTRPFVPVNCSAIPDNLAESILFGHTRGSFTGATADRKGSFDMANGGTLFLDEIGDMLPAIQAKLLRVLEDSTVCPVGASNGHKVDVRIIAATNANLQQKMALGAFRSDLYHRLSSYVISLQPLRAHKDDIPLLVEHFVRLLSGEMGFRAPQITPEAMKALSAHSFPGNVRELKNVIERALIKAAGKEIRPAHIQVEVAGVSFESGAANASATQDMPLNLEELEKLAIGKALATAGGNVSAAARMLGIGRTQLYRKMPEGWNASADQHPG